MGYYTNYEFAVYDYGRLAKSSATNKAIARKIVEMNESDSKAEMFYPIVDEIKITYIEEGDPWTMQASKDEVKWYDHDKEMLALSVAFPDVTFRLYGEGEERDDVWQTYYKNGKMIKYTATIEIPDFNPNDLE